PGRSAQRTSCSRSSPGRSLVFTPSRSACSTWPATSTPFAPGSITLSAKAFSAPLTASSCSKRWTPTACSTFLSNPGRWLRRPNGLMNRTADLRKYRATKTCQDVRNLFPCGCWRGLPGKRFLTRGLDTFVLPQVRFQIVQGAQRNQVAHLGRSIAASPSEFCGRHLKGTKLPVEVFGKLSKLRWCGREISFADRKFQGAQLPIARSEEHTSELQS